MAKIFTPLNKEIDRREKQARRSIFMYLQYTLVCVKIVLIKFVIFIGGVKMSFFDIFKVNEFKARIAELEYERKRLGFQEYNETKAAIERLKRETDEEINRKRSELERMQRKVETDISNSNQIISTLREEIANLSAEKEKLEKQTKSSVNKIQKAKELYRAIDYSLNFFHAPTSFEESSYHPLNEEQTALLNELAPTVSLNLHCMDMRDLRTAYRNNEKQIDKLVESYKGRYTTKANQTIYELMVIALRAELQNVLYVLKYDKLEKGVESIKLITSKYLSIATKGNQSIAPTMTRFIGEIEYLFINAVKIEYNYYVKKEQAKQEQQAIREQMRQEAEERKALEQERKKIEAEEKKFLNEIERIREQIKDADEQTAEKLKSELLEVESSLADVAVKKEEIVNLQNGKAGNIYIISNLGSFGENVFKIGMTRRLDPQDRVDELGSASVPFKFDVHSFIFSEDAVVLENELHKRLNEQRVNKVNMRKEFFYSTIDELEALTLEISPSAEFNRTMLAEEFRQSQSSEGNYTSDFRLDEDEEEEE